jgi:hypothetical protein
VDLLILRLILSERSAAIRDQALGVAKVRILGPLGKPPEKGWRQRRAGTIKKPPRFPAAVFLHSNRV